MRINKKTVAIIAPTGMLGSGVYSILKDKYKLVLIYRNNDKLELLDKKYGKVAEQKNICFNIESLMQNPEQIKGLIKKIGTIDSIINCSGIINKYADEDIKKTFFINADFPNLLSDYYEDKLIQITTDCVYNGMDGFPYNENSRITSLDSYGISKYLGEPQKSLTLRTSIVGEELSGSASLLEWFKSNNNKTVMGYAKHYWNGITAREYGRICDTIIKNRKQFPKNGTYHVFSEKVSKYEMLKSFKEKYGLNVKIIKDTEKFCDRTLSTIYPVQKKLKINSFKKMIQDLN